MIEEHSALLNNDASLSPPDQLFVEGLGILKPEG